MGCSGCSLHPSGIILVSQVLLLECIRVGEDLDSHLNLQDVSEAPSPGPLPNCLQVTLSLSEPSMDHHIKVLAKHGWV